MGQFLIEIFLKFRSIVVVGETVKRFELNDLVDQMRRSASE